MHKEKQRGNPTCLQPPLPWEVEGVLDPEIYQRKGLSPQTPQHDTQANPVWVGEQDALPSQVSKATRGPWLRDRWLRNPGGCQAASLGQARLPGPN